MVLRVVSDKAVSFWIIDDNCILSCEGFGSVDNLCHGVGWKAHASLYKVGVGQSAQCRR